MKGIVIALSLLFLESFIPSPQQQKSINWDKVDSLVMVDTVMTPSEKISFQKLLDTPDIDNARIKVLEQAPYYKYMKDNILDKLK